MPVVLSIILTLTLSCATNYLNIIHNQYNSGHQNIGNVIYDMSFNDLYTFNSAQTIVLIKLFVFDLSICMIGLLQIGVQKL